MGRNLYLNWAKIRKLVRRCEFVRWLCLLFECQLPIVYFTMLYEGVGDCINHKVFVKIY